MSEIRSWGAKAVLTVVLCCLTHGNALADFTFDISGSTTGQFYYGTAPLGTSVGGLSFTGTNFGATATTGTDTVVDLGIFSLDTLFSQFDLLDFRLFEEFTVPTIAGTLFKADLSGIAWVSGGSANVDFDNTPRHFTFTGPKGSGTFDLVITDLTVINFSTAAIKGRITNIAASPEPAAILLTSVLMGGVIVLFRKRLRDC